MAFPPLIPSRRFRADPVRRVNQHPGFGRDKAPPLAGRLRDAGRLKHYHVSMGKRNNVWVARECAKLAREILGANGIVDDYPVIRHMLNIESVYTYEGTHDIHNLVIGDRITGIPAYNAPQASAKAAEPVAQEA